MQKKIYTRSGDKGETSLFTGERVKKNDLFIHALGTVDECNSTIGVALSFLPSTKIFGDLRMQLETIQHALFDLGASVATPLTHATKSKLDKTRFDQEATTLLEHWIDTMEASLPVLHTFILPGGHPAGAMLHLARSICRRAERDLIPLNLHSDLSDHLLVYLNRLSDYLFVASRFLNHIAAVPEMQWQPHKKVTE